MRSLVAKSGRCVAGGGGCRVPWTRPVTSAASSPLPKKRMSPHAPYVWLGEGMAAPPGLVGRPPKPVDALFNASDAHLMGRFRSMDATAVGSNVAKLYPEAAEREVIVLGRSNVGKSSLLASVLRAPPRMFRVSNTPGRTQHISQWLVKGLGVVTDAPGYGYAKAPVGVVHAWQQTLEQYLSQRAHALRRIFVLLDARVPVKDADYNGIAWLHQNNLPWAAVLTKVDKVGSRHMEAKALEVIAALGMLQGPLRSDTVICTSAKTGLGVPELRTMIARELLSKPSQDQPT